MVSLKQDGKRLLIQHNNKTVYTIYVNQVLMLVGKSKNDFKMSHGSFKIKEKVTERYEVTVKSFTLNGDEAELILSHGTLIIRKESDDRLVFIPKYFGIYNTIWIEIPAEPDEYVYGSGETFSEFNLRGQIPRVWVAEHINAVQIARKLVNVTLRKSDSAIRQKFTNYETYYAQPTFISSRKYFCHCDTTAKSTFDFSHKNFHRIRMDSIAPFHIGFGDDFEAVLQNLTSLLGRQPALPDWVYDGKILGIQGGTDVMMQKVDNVLSHGGKVCGVWIQDWEGRRVTAVGKQLFWNWEWDRELYPGLDKKINELNAKGIMVLGYCNPFLAVEKPLYKEAAEKGYCVKAKDGSDYLVTITTFPAAMVDLTNPEAYEWLKGIIKKNMIELGLSGWMADFGEYLPTDCVLHSGENPELIHNTWPARWAKLNREAVEESGKLGEIMFFTRAGYTETVKHSTMMWNGDNHVDFSTDFGLPSVMPAMLSLTCCGFGLSHSDIGGYTTFFNLKRDEELYMRWCEMNAFSPLMRSHEGLNPDLNAQFDASEEVLTHTAIMSNIHSQLKPYLKEAVKYNAEKGVGVVRPLFFYYDEKDAYEERFEYLLGRDILVAPVIERGNNLREVYLPDDEWIHLESGITFCGGRYTFNAPVGRIPVFVRKNAPDWVLDIALNLNFGGKKK